MNRRCAVARLWLRIPDVFLSTQAAALFSSFRPVCWFGLRDGEMPVAGIAPRNHGTPRDHAAATHPFFEAATDRSNFFQQNVAKFDLRDQSGLRRTARS